MFGRFLAGILLISSFPAFAQTGALPVHYCAQAGVQAKTSGLNSSNYLQGIIPSCTVTVYLTGTQTLATTTPQSPFTANTDGSIPPTFAAVNQGYDVVLSGGIAPNTYPHPRTITDVFPSSQFISPDQFTLTTNGSSGASTYINHVLNIPIYGGGGCVDNDCVLTDPTATQTVTQPGGTGFYTNILNGTYEAKQFQTPPNTGNNGIANAVAAQCTGAGCMVESDPSYASTEIIPGETSSGYGGNVYSAIPNWPTLTHVRDERGGHVVDLYAEGGTAQYSPTWQNARYYFNTYQVTGPTLSFSGYSDQCNFEGTGQQINGFGGVNLKSYWTCKVLNAISTAQGQTLMNIKNVQCNGVGDCINTTRFTYSSGGVNAYSDEGTHDQDVGVFEQHAVPNGTITSIGSGYVQASMTSGQGTQGQGRYLGDMNPAKVISGSYPSSYTSGDFNFPPSPTIWGIDGQVPPMAEFAGTTFTPSHMIMGCTTAYGGACPNNSSTNPSGQLKSAANGYAPGVVNVQVVPVAPGLPNVYETTSASFATGDKVCVADSQYMEETTVAAVPDASHITIDFTKPHWNGFTISKASAAGCGYGIEVTGATTTQGGVTYRQVWPLVGVIDATHILVWDHNSQQNWSRSLTINNNAYCGTATVESFSNTGTTIKMYESGVVNPIWQNASNVVVTTANATYNGTFMLTPFQGYNDGGIALGLSYVAASAPSGTVPTTGTITFCNTGYNLYPIAEVKDVLNPSTHAVDGYFKIAANNGDFAVGDAVSEFHWPAQSVVIGGAEAYQELPMLPYTGFTNYNLAVGDNFTGGWSILRLQNVTSTSKYRGYGGQLPTAAMGLSTAGLFQDDFYLANAPDEAVIRVNACKPSPVGCNNAATSRFAIYMGPASQEAILDNPTYSTIDFAGAIRINADLEGAGIFGQTIYSPTFGRLGFSSVQGAPESLTPNATLEANAYELWSSFSPPTGFEHVKLYGDSSTGIGMQFDAVDGSHTTYQGGNFTLGSLQFYLPNTTTAVKNAGISTDGTTGDLFLDGSTKGDKQGIIYAKDLHLTGACTGCGSGMVYPGAGVPNSTGSAWGSSYVVGTAPNNLVQLNGSSQLPAVSAANLTNFPTLNQSTTGNAATASALQGSPTSGQYWGYNGTAQGWYTPSGSGNTTSTALTPNTIPKANGANSIVNSSISDDGTNVTIGEPLQVSGSGNGFDVTEAAAPAGVAGHDLLYADVTAHRWKMNNNNGGATTVAALESPALTGTPTAPTAAGGTNTTQIATTAFVQAALPTGTVTKTICSGTISIPATAIASGAKAAFTGTCTGGATTDNVSVDFAGGTDPTTLTGFLPGTGGILTIFKWVSANTVNVTIENNTAASITPTAFTLNYRVVR